MSDTISVLEKERLKARYGFELCVKLYTYGQKGFFDVLAQEWKTAEPQSAARKLAENNQPPPTTQSATWTTGG